MECPACKSKRINLVTLFGVYECPICGYRGPVALEKKKSNKLKVK